MSVCAAISVQSEEETAPLNRLETLNGRVKGCRRKLRTKWIYEYGMCNKFDIHVSHTRNFNAMNMHLQYQIQAHAARRTFIALFSLSFTITISIFMHALKCHHTNIH